ncbi:MAG: tetratricopeptide repeat protein [Planctomycetes bacterium]|nr:tetratricopeptide repeat protein [Planctomycetota bacterium]
MSFLQKWMTSRSLARLRDRVASAPSIATYADLARAFVAANDLTEAERVLDEGLELFPGAGDLERMRRLVKSHKLADRVKEVRRRLDLHPTPALYHELVELQLQCNDPASAEVTVSDWKRLFPADGGAELASIKISLRRFYSERAAADGRAALAGLERLLQRDPGHARALRLMAELCSRIGALPRAVEALNRLSQIVPDDPEVDCWRKTVEEATQSGKHVRVDVSRALREIEETGQFPDPIAPVDDTLPSPRNTRADRKAPKVLDAARPAFARLAKSAGVRIVVLVRGSAALVRGAPSGAAEGMARATRALSLTSRRLTRRMGLGSFVEAVIETEDGVVVLRGADQASAAAVVDGFQRFQDVRGAVADLASSPGNVEQVLEGAEGELVHA